MSKPSKVLIRGVLEGRSPSSTNLPLMQGIYIHIMERGIKGVR